MPQPSAKPPGSGSPGKRPPALHAISRQQTSGSRQEPIEALRELSESERSVAQLMALRKTNREIAETLFLSEGTVKQYINRIYSKLQLTGTAQEKRRALTALLQKN